MWYSLGRSRAIWIVSALLTLLVAAASGRPSPPPPEGRQELDPPDPTPRSELAAITRQLASGPDGLRSAVERLGALEKRDLTTGEREDWLRLARTAAIRSGDKPRLESLRDAPDRFALVEIQRILLASASLAAADFPAVRAHLAQVGEPEAMNEREKRRCYSILARLARLEGDFARERVYVDKLVDHLQHWPKPMCQSCHATLAEPDRITHLSVSDLWFGERFVALIKEDGGAERIRAESASRLSRRPDDARARIRLGFALRALGREAEAAEAFKALPWAESPDRPSRKPRMMTPFP